MRGPSGIDHTVQSNSAALSSYCFGAKIVWPAHAGGARTWKRGRNGLRAAAQLGACRDVESVQSLEILAGESFDMATM